jgi:hypothetical protein
MTADDLNKRMGLPINSICGNGYTDPDDNHCAHFVSHVMSFQFGTTCRTMKSGTQLGANIRVQEEARRWPCAPGQGFGRHIIPKRGGQEALRKPATGGECVVYPKRMA